MDCPHCGEPSWTDGARRCMSCGGSLLPADRPPLSELASAVRIACPRCGVENSEIDPACVQCGGELLVATLFDMTGAALRRRLVALVGVGVELAEHQGLAAARFREALDDERDP